MFKKKDYLTWKNINELLILIPARYNSSRFKGITSKENFWKRNGCKSCRAMCKSCKQKKYIYSN